MLQAENVVQEAKGQNFITRVEIVGRALRVAVKRVDCPTVDAFCGAVDLTFADGSRLRIINGPTFILLDQVQAPS